MSKIRIGFLGFGVVGQGVWKHITRNRKTLEERLGCQIELSKVVVRNLNKKRDVKVPEKKLSTDPAFILEDPSIDIVCELMGGVEEPYQYTLLALRAGKTVVTANKALLCEKGKSLFNEARKSGSRIFYEASVAGGIPVIKTLREGLVANRIQKIEGILNGTSNYILTRMEREKIDFAPVLKEARALGYVEADESLDLDGIDAAHKAVILAYLSFGKWISLKQMIVEGITQVSLTDIQYAKELGYKIKLMAHIFSDENLEQISVSVYPTLVPFSSVISKVDEVYNAVSITGDVLGTTTLIGRGAGQDATASAVISDVSDAIIAIANGQKDSFFLRDLSSDMGVLPKKQLVSEYYVRLKVADRTGVLAKLTSVLAKYNISIATMIQNELPDEQTASLIFTTHSSNEKEMSEALKHLEKLQNVLDKPMLLRIGK